MEFFVSISGLGVLLFSGLYQDRSVLLGTEARPTFLYSLQSSQCYVFFLTAKGAFL